MSCSKIFRVKEEEAKKISASPGEPHRHDFEEQITGMEGMPEHFIDQATEPLTGSLTMTSVKN